MFRLSPVDPISKVVDPMLTPENMKYLIEQMGLDKPIDCHYSGYAENAGFDEGKR